MKFSAIFFGAILATAVSAKVAAQDAAAPTKTVIETQTVTKTQTVTEHLFKTVYKTSTEHEIITEYKTKTKWAKATACTTSASKPIASAYKRDLPVKKRAAADEMLYVRQFE